MFSLHIRDDGGMNDRNANLPDTGHERRWRTSSDNDAREAEAG
jgi:hypothetical protein